MKTIGLIGGMSWESTMEYYRILNQKVKEKLGGFHSAELVLYSVDFEEIERLQHEGDWESLTKLMVEAAKRVERGGADFLLLCTNTMHKMADEMEKAIQIPFLHIADATAGRIKNAGLKKVGLLGTRFTMEQDFYKGRLIKKHGLEVIVPYDEEREMIHHVIYHELCLGEICDSSKEAYLATIKRLVEQGAEGIILGCTEIGLLIKQEDVSVPIFDTTLIHAEAAVEYALTRD
ncbi:putative racemase [[Clostridium] ultunense Esp]|uniref:aspartate/glutamate racemase family protein n=1 Tax=Thermicanus aegyptius TaxID=94009 RepID=UPI0002B6F2A4|nr:aspartate/glutamate racemase family protein [Thermicanus aegyptius]CCQ94473.1 putative racemase [[Clostridium] ultunense Esp]